MYKSFLLKISFFHQFLSFFFLERFLPYSLLFINHATYRLALMKFKVLSDKSLLRLGFNYLIVFSIFILLSFSEGGYGEGACLLWYKERSL